MKLKLTAVRDLSASTREFDFSCDAGAKLSFSAGQFYRFVFTDDAGEFERSYSICNFDASVSSGIMTPQLVISQVANGRATRLLFGDKAGLPGLEARVTGPFGRLTLPEKLPPRIFLVATSVGIAPYMPILAALEPALAAGDTEVILMFGIRDQSEFLYQNHLTRLAREFDNFRLHVCSSREQLPVTEAVHRHHGYVQEAVKSYVPTAETGLWYLCGNPSMIDEVYAMLKQAGLGVRHVIREKYVFAKQVASKSAGPTAEQKKLIAEKLKKFQS
ncbi:MAG: hypothetical protein KDI36_00450 [Pseudomonadales bacterium]|nr:hypothetical protein [Pseudomonadales bacterium]